MQAQTVTKAKPKAATAQTVQKAAVVKTVPAKVKAPKVETKAAPKVEVKAEPSIPFYFYQTTPGGMFLRAYFLALIAMQIGGLVPDKAFRVWPSANISGHVATGRVKAQGKGRYMLTTTGVNYFTDPASKPDNELLDKMLASIKNGADNGLKLGAMTKAG